MAVKKKPGPKPTTGTGKPIMVRCHADLLARVDKWRRTQPDIPTRPQAILRLAARGLS